MVVSVKKKQRICTILVKQHGCSHYCIFCRSDTSESDQSVVPEVLDVKAVLAVLDRFRQEGFSRVEISGADPIEYEALPKLVREIRSRGFRFVRVATHGERLADPILVDNLFKAGVDCFKISLYGANAKLHDSITRAKGSFANTVQGIKNIKEARRKGTVFLKTLLLRQNAEDLVNIVDFMHHLECDAVIVTIPEILHGDYSFYIPHIMQGRYFRKLVRYAIRTGKVFELRDIPYCVVGFDNPWTNNFDVPLVSGEQFKPETAYRSGQADAPFYRRKVKVKLCEACAVSHKCDGLWQHDVVRFGLGQLKNISTR